MRPENSKKLRKKATIVSYQWPDEKETCIVKSSVGLSRGEARILKTGNPEESNSIKTRNIRNEQKENPEMGELSKVIIMLLISSPKYERWYEVTQCELKADVDVFCDSEKHVRYSAATRTRKRELMLTNLASLPVKTRISSRSLLPTSFESRQNADERRERYQLLILPPKFHYIKPKVSNMPILLHIQRIALSIFHSAQKILPIRH